MAVYDITPVSERIKPAHPLIGIRRPIVLSSTVLPFIIWLLWELLSK